MENVHSGDSLLLLRVWSFLMLSFLNHAQTKSYEKQVGFGVFVTETVNITAKLHKLRLSYFLISEHMFKHSN